MSLKGLREQEVRRMLEERLILRRKQMDSREVSRGQGVMSIVVKNSARSLRFFSVPFLSISYQILRSKVSSKNGKDLSFLN